MSVKRVAAFVVWGAVIDLTVFLMSFIFFGGAHGPAGPMFVLGVLNWPGTRLYNVLVPMEKGSNAQDAVFMFVVVIASGAVYGLLAGLIVAARDWWQRARKP